jgi:hypothetical protein
MFAKDPFLNRLKAKNSISSLRIRPLLSRQIRFGPRGFWNTVMVE